ncbi:MAG: hypothetical protein U0694_18470 [Anaerolineae bacterium]
MFEISPNVPADTQRLRLTVGAPPGTISVTYVMDGEEVGSVSASPWALWWTLQEGDHELVAVATLVDGTQQTSAAIPFRVVEYEPPQSREASP